MSSKKPETEARVTMARDAAHSATALGRLQQVAVLHPREAALQRAAVSGIGHHQARKTGAAEA